MAKYRFWILFAVGLAAAAIVWFLAVPKKLEQIRKRAEELEVLAQRVDRAADDAIGKKTLQSQSERLRDFNAALGKFEKGFEEGDRKNLDRWFPALAMDSWEARPSAADFKQQYLRSYDALKRVLSRGFEKRGVKVRGIPLIEFPWMKEGRPEVNSLRELQQEFWVQDRLLRAAARYGAVPVDALAVGQTEKPLGLGVRVFERRRYRIAFDCPPSSLRRLLHAFDGPFESRDDEGKAETIGLRVGINQVAISRVDPARYSDRLAEDLPVRVRFDLVVLNYSRESKEAN